MIKLVYQVQVRDKFGYADTLEQASKWEDTFKASFDGEAINSSRSVDNSVLI